ncbi:Hsp20/alpha crystallin family protein [candidate division KSB1 bacterium]|nr:MAG: Hsp20/alpha crystallin family protein [candidate division KSB1 bacterium]
MLVKWEPTLGLTRVNDVFDRMLEDFFSADTRFFGEPVTSLMPLMNIEETKDAYKISVELPGMEKDDIDIEVKDNVLTISGEKKEERESEEGTFYRRERRFGKFSRSINLPNDINIDDISAEYKNGVLMLTLPKTEEAKPKKITVKNK